MRGILRLVGISLFLFLFFGVAEAQQVLETFGKNRIQHKQFRWNYLSSENFDVYYYDDRKKVA